MADRPDWHGRAPDQTGFVVAHLETAVEMFTARLGLHPWSVFTYDAETLPSRIYRGHPGDFVTRSAVWNAGRIGLVQPLSGTSVYSEALAATGPGFHHLGYFVPSMSEARVWMVEHGHEELMSGGGHGLDGDGAFAFFDLPGATRIELIERPKRRAVSQR